MLKNKNIVLTGSLQGIGKETVKKLAGLGAHIWACSHYVDEEFLEFCNYESKSNSVESIPISGDLSDLESVKTMAKEILKSKKDIDGLVNVAGITKDSLFQMTSSQDLKKVYEVNFFSTILLTQFVVKKMMRKKSGSIVNISSISAIDGVAGQLSYSSSKASILGATKTLSRELGKNGIRVNAIAPGVIDTSMNECVPFEILEERIKSTSLKRMGQPEEVSNLIAFLLSDLSSYVTGQVIRIDGGMA